MTFTAEEIAAAPLLETSFESLLRSGHVPVQILTAISGPEDHGRVAFHGHGRDFSKDLGKYGFRPQTRGGQDSQSLATSQGWC